MNFKLCPKGADSSRELFKFLNYKITEENIGERLDRFLSSGKGRMSRNQVQKLIKNGAVTVNNKTVSSSYSLKEEDVVVFDNSKPEVEIMPKDEEFAKIKIVAESDDYIVINKPANLSVHGAESIKEQTLVDFLIQKYPEIKKVGEDSFRPGIVHRLDKDVSGLMVIAKSNKMFNSLKEQFKTKKIHKKYIALVFGVINKEKDTIDFSIKRSTKGYKMASVPKVNAHLYKNAREAITHLKVLKSFINFTLLELKIETGRTHQIRTHLYAYGHPVVGDKLYHTKRTKEKNIKFKNNLKNRIFLFSSELAFKDLNKEKQVFHIDMPEELEDFLEIIK